MPLWYKYVKIRNAAESALEENDMSGQETGQRGSWGSKIAFIFAASGSAIGLGNIWRFPLMVGLNGGAIFVFCYILAILFIGFPVMLAEFTMGRHTTKNPVGAYNTIKPRSFWQLFGYMGALGGACILSYYSVIAGWALGYFYRTAAGTFRGEITLAQSGTFFQNFASNPLEMVLCLFVIIGITTFVISKGVRAGIERWAKVLMPVLLGLIILLAIRAITLPGASTGLSYYLKPDFSKLNTTVIFFALGQAFFSLGLGVGTMITYASYLSKKDNLVTSAGWVSFSDTLVALFAGIIIFPTLFATPGVSPENFSIDTGLMFQVFPIIISKIPGGYFFGVLFFFLLLLAALTSTVSMLEIPVAYFVDERNWTRRKATFLVGGFCFVLGIPSALSVGGVDILTRFGFLGKMDLIFGNIVLAVGALAVCLFVSYVWKVKNALQEIASGNDRFKLRFLWVFSVKYLAPLFILIILIFIRRLTG